MHTLVRTRTSSDTHIQARARSTSSYVHRYARVREADRESGPRSLMFVKVINFLCEIRGSGGRTQGDGCQLHKLPPLSSADTRAPRVHSSEPLLGHRGYPRIPWALTNKGFEWGKMIHK